MPWFETAVKEYGDKVAGVRIQVAPLVKQREVIDIILGYDLQDDQGDHIPVRLEAIKAGIKQWLIPYHKHIQELETLRGKTALCMTQLIDKIARHDKETSSIKRFWLRREIKDELAKAKELLLPN